MQVLTCFLCLANQTSPSSTRKPLHGLRTSLSREVAGTCLGWSQPRWCLRLALARWRLAVSHFCFLHFSWTLNEPLLYRFASRSSPLLKCHPDAFRVECQIWANHAIDSSHSEVRWAHRLWSRAGSHCYYRLTFGWVSLGSSTIVAACGPSCCLGSLHIDCIFTRWACCFYPSWNGRNSWRS